MGGMVRGIKNSAERQSDTQQHKAVPSADLGETKQTGSVWSKGFHQEAKLLHAEKSHLKAIVAVAQKLSLGAAKIQEDQHMADDASSRADVRALSAAKKLKRASARLKIVDKKEATRSVLAEKLKQASEYDKEALLNIGHVNGDAANAAAAEHSGWKQTKTEVKTGVTLMKAIAKELLPSL